MSTTLLRLGFWTLIIVLALYVLATTYPDQAWAELIPMRMLTQSLGVSALLIVAGIVFTILGKSVSAVAKNRCRVCRTAITPGAIYCREHLRNILSDEDDRTHSTRTRR